MDQNTWNGLTGKEVREKIQNIEKQANNTDTIVNNLLNENRKIKSEYLPSYVDDIIEGYMKDGTFYADDLITTVIDGEIGKIYVDLETNYTYRWSGSAYTEISNGDEIQKRLDNFNKQENTSIETVIANIQKEVEGKVTIDPSKGLSTNDYTNAEMHKFTIIAALPSTDYTDKVYYLKQDNGSYLKGLYYHDGTKWQRVGGLL